MTAASIRLDSAQLSRVVQAVDPSARLVSARLLRRAIRVHLDLPSGQHVPHDFCFELPRSKVLECIDASELGDNAESLPERILLIRLPEEEELAAAEHALTACWRWLFHAAIDRAVERRVGKGVAAGGSNGFRQDPVLFNATMLDEIRTVLTAEHRLIAPDDAAALYCEFCALFLELHYFTPHLVDVYFPGFLEPSRVAELLERELSAKSLFESSRPLGAPAPGLVHHEERRSEPETASVALAAAAAPEETTRIARATEQGNDVRAAILNRRLGKVTEAEERLHHLVDRLQKPLRLHHDDRRAWYASLRPLLEPAALGFWPVAGRLLFELQKACLDIERKVFAIDLVEWFITFGKLPIRRLLDKPKELNVLRRLRSALAYADRVPLSLEQRDALLRLLHAAIEAAEHRVRQSNRPVLNEVLDSVGLVPKSQAEKIARHKLVEELLDVLCGRGFLKMSDLRDAIARNRLKLADLAGPGEFFAGDSLLRANRMLALRLSGVYRRGEIYLRGLQRLTSLAFATPVGRLLVLWLILPFGGAFILLEGLHHFVEAIAGVASLVTGTNTTVAAVGLVAGGPAAVMFGEPPGGSPIMTSNAAVVLVGLFLLGMLHAPTFRQHVGRWACRLFIDVPRAVYRSPLVRALVANPVVHFFFRYLLTPVIGGALSLTAMRLAGFDWEATLAVAAGTALLLATLFRTPWGWGLEERMDEVVSRIWRVLSVNFVFGLLTLILRFFQAVFEYIDRAFYAVDEWLRFREGENSASFLFKLTLGTGWFFVAYVFRFAWNLLIEPQINPIKHFPVVTVSHKLLLPMVPSLARSFDMSLPTMTTIVSGIPGIFGFLVWECKENWKLYKANSSKIIGPTAVGSHGESIRGLLRPGLHSGVVPKQYAKLRKAEAYGNHKKAVRIHHHLEHVAEAVRHLAQRELTSCLESSRRWAGLPIGVQAIRLATNRLRIQLAIGQHQGGLVISIEERHGWLIGSIEQTAWLKGLSAPQRAALADVVTLLYKLGGVHLVREQAAALFDVESWRIDCRLEGIVVLGRQDEGNVVIDFDDSPVLEPSGPIDGRKIAPLARAELDLSERPLEWQRWVERWEEDLSGKAPVGPILEGCRVL